MAHHPLKSLTLDCIFSLHQEVYHADILIALCQMLASPLSHTCLLRAEHLVSCLIQLIQHQT